MTNPLTQLKQKIYQSWNSTNYATFGQILEVGVRDFVDRLEIPTGIQVLDVACGTGNCSLPLAQRGATVTGVDIAPNLLAVAREKAAALNLTISFEEGDAEALSYNDNAFDLVTSSFGVIFAPRHQLAATELLRVCQPGGTIALMSWTDEGLVGQLTAIQTHYIPLPPGLPSHTLWGKPEIVQSYFGNNLHELRCHKRTLPLTFPTDATGVVAFFRQHSALRYAFDKLDTAEQSALQRDLEALWNKHNIAENGRITVNAEYLEIIAVKSTT